MSSWEYQNIGVVTNSTNHETVKRFFADYLTMDEEYSESESPCSFHKPDIFVGNDYYYMSTEYYLSDLNDDDDNEFTITQKNLMWLLHALFHIDKFYVQNVECESCDDREIINETVYDLENLTANHFYLESCIGEDYECRRTRKNKITPAKPSEKLLKFLADAASKNDDLELVALLLDLKKQLYQTSGMKNKENAETKDIADVSENKNDQSVADVQVADVLRGKKIVVTGKLATFKSRSELKECLNSIGITLTETLNAETAYLITNTPDSGSAKNKKAVELGIQRITEAEFNDMIGRKP